MRFRGLKRGKSLLLAATSADDAWRLNFREHLEWFFGYDFRELQTHDKTFPGYDIASLNRALLSFFQEACAEFQEIGACQNSPTIRGLFDNPLLLKSFP